MKLQTKAHAEPIQAIAFAFTGDAVYFQLMLKISDARRGKLSAAACRR